MKLFLIAATAGALVSASAAHAQNWGMINQQQLATQQMLQQQQLQIDMQNMITEQQLNSAYAQAMQNNQRAFERGRQNPNCSNGWVVGQFGVMC
jgi:hypothetical protein